MINFDITALSQLAKSTRYKLEYSALLSGFFMGGISKYSLNGKATTSL